MCRCEKLDRKDFTASEAVAVAEFFTVEEKAKAEQRMKATLKQGTEVPAVENFPSGKKGKTRDVLGSYVGLSGKTLESQNLVEAARTDPETFGSTLYKVKCALLLFRFLSFFFAVFVDFRRLQVCV